jgi:hypothetical protein
MKILQLGEELIHAGGRTDRHDEANCSFSQFSERAQQRAACKYESTHRCFSHTKSEISKMLVTPGGTVM